MSANSLLDQWHNDFVASKAISQGIALGRFILSQLRIAFPEFQEFKFGYFVEEDLPKVMAKGWRQLRVCDLPEAGEFRERFNREASSRFALVQKADTSLWFRRLAICYMPIWLYDRNMKAQREAMQAASAKSAVVEPDGTIVESETESWRVNNEHQKRPVGRPRKKE